MKRWQVTGVGGVMEREDNLVVRGLLAGIAIGAAVGAGVALMAMPSAIPSSPNPETHRAGQLLELQHLLAAGEAYLRVGRYLDARTMYVLALQIDCGNAQARQGLHASTVGTPFARKRARERVQGACGGRT